MRIAAVGLLSADAFDLARDIAALTHGHPSGFLAAGAFAVMVAQTHGRKIAAPLRPRGAPQSERPSRWRGGDRRNWPGPWTRLPVAWVTPQGFLGSERAVWRRKLLPSPSIAPWSPLRSRSGCFWRSTTVATATALAPWPAACWGPPWGRRRSMRICWPDWKVGWSSSRLPTTWGPCLTAQLPTFSDIPPGSRQSERCHAGSERLVALGIGNSDPRVRQSRSA